MEHQECVLGTVCAAAPISVGSTAAALVVSLPASRPATAITRSEMEASVGRPMTLRLATSTVAKRGVVPARTRL